MTSSVSATVGSRLRQLRSERGISMRQLATSLGISAATVSAIENGQTGVTVDRLAGLADRLGVPAWTLLHGRPDPARPADDRDWRHFPSLRTDAVLEAAIEVFVATGYHGATMRSIAAMAGMSVPNVYHHYESKQDILVRILDDIMDDIDWRLDAAIRDVPEPLSRLSRLVEALALYHASRPKRAFIGATEMRSVAEPARTRIAARRTAVQRRIDVEVTHAVERREATTTMPLETGRTIATMCTSLPQWYDPAGSTPPHAIAAEYARLALRMVGATPAGRHGV